MAAGDVIRQISRRKTLAVDISHTRRHNIEWTSTIANFAAPP